MPGCMLRSLIIASVLSLAGTAQADIPASERTVLLDLYTSTGGATWVTSTNWNGAAGTECTWYGITCGAGQGHVTGIDLHTNNLVGTLPLLNGLTALQVFNASSEPWFFGNHNHLSGSIPSLSGLTALTDFDVRKNQLSGSLPALSGLTALQSFLVNDNQLSGSIPALDGLTALQYLQLGNNQLSGLIPSLSGLTALQTFGAGNNQLTGQIPALTGLTNLGSFGVSGNQLTGPIPSLTGLTNLYTFYSNSNQLTGSIPALTELTNLHYFRVENNQLTGNVPSVPSPSALAPGWSGLCPNFLNHTADPAWDAATGVTPWYTSCTGGSLPPALVGVASRKVHGGTGTFDLSLAP